MFESAPGNPRLEPVSGQPPLCTRIGDPGSRPFNDINPGDVDDQPVIWAIPPAASAITVAVYQ